MIDVALLLVCVTAIGAAGAFLLHLLRAAPPTPSERLVAELAAGMGVGGATSLGLAAAGCLRPLPLVVAGGLALAVGGGALRDTVRSLHWRWPRRAWPLLAVCGVVLVTELVTMLAPPVGGDQTKYQLVYPRLYGQTGTLVPTPWSFWGEMQFLQNFLFAIGYALHGEVLARFFNGLTGVLAAAAVGLLTGRQFGRVAGVAAAALFFTLPITWSLMTRAGSDLPVVLYGALATAGLLEWARDGDGGALRRAALMAGFAGGSKVMGLLVPALVGIGVLVVLARRSWPVVRAAGVAVAFGVIVLAAASPWYVRNALDTGNPIYPFGYGLLGGTHWSAAASEYLGDYYTQYQETWATRRSGAPYAGVALVRFPWDLTMHPNSFEKGARQSLDVSPFALAFTPALLLLRRGRGAALTIAAVGLGYAGIIAGAAWAHPRYVLPGVVLVLAASVPAAQALLGRRGFAWLVAVAVIGNVALATRLLEPLWPDQARVALGRLDAREFLRRHSDRYSFWERANAAIPSTGRVLVLEKIPHPYYIERPFVLGSYLEQGLLDYRTLDTPERLAAAARTLGITHVSVDLSALDATGDPFEAEVSRLWRAFVDDACEPLLRQEGFGLYSLRPVTAFVANPEGPRG
jgi:hypothetical protein